MAGQTVVTRLLLTTLLLWTSGLSAPMSASREVALDIDGLLPSAKNTLINDYDDNDGVENDSDGVSNDSIQDKTTMSLPTTVDQSPSLSNSTMTTMVEADFLAERPSSTINSTGPSSNTTTTTTTVTTTIVPNVVPTVPVIASDSIVLENNINPDLYRKMFQSIIIDLYHNDTTFHHPTIMSATQRNNATETIAMQFGKALTRDILFQLGFNYNDIERWFNEGVSPLSLIQFAVNNFFRVLVDTLIFALLLRCNLTKRYLVRIFGHRTSEDIAMRLIPRNKYDDHRQ